MGGACADVPGTKRQSWAKCVYGFPDGLSLCPRNSTSTDLSSERQRRGGGGRGDQVLQAVTHANLETAQQAVTAPDPVSLRLRVLCSDALGLG